MHALPPPARCHARRPHLASEALQHAYLRVARHVRACDQPGQWHVWLRVVARSALADLRRGQRRFWQLRLRRAAEPAGEELAPAAEDAAEDALHAQLDAALARLSADARHLLERKYLRGDSVETLAAALGLTVKATESRLTRARAALRDAFARRAAGAARDPQPAPLPDL